MKFRKIQPIIEVEAVRYLGFNYQQIMDFTEEHATGFDNFMKLKSPYFGYLSIGDWVVKNEDGEFSVLKQETMERIYED